MNNTRPNHRTPKPSPETEFRRWWLDNMGRLPSRDDLIALRVGRTEDANLARMEALR